MAIEHKVYDDMSGNLEKGNDNVKITSKDLIENLVSISGVAVSSKEDYETFTAMSKSIGRKIPMVDKNFKGYFSSGKYPSWNSIVSYAKKVAPEYKELVLKLPANTSMENRRRVARANLYGGKITEKEMKDMHKVYNIMQVMAVKDNGEIVPVMSYTLTSGGAMDGRVYKRMGIDTTNINPKGRGDMEIAMALQKNEKEKGTVIADSQKERQNFVAENDNILSNTEVASAKSYYKKLSIKKNNEGIKLIQEKLNALGIPVTVDGDIGRETIAGIARFQKDNGLKVDGQAGNNTLTAMNLINTKGKSKNFYV